MKKLQFVGIAVIMAESALAGNITWNGGAGDTDLSKPANWSGGKLSGADNATINVNNQTFTLEKNTSFNTMTLGTTAKTATFDFSANPTNEVYLGTASGNAFAPSASGMVFTFKGGVWRGTGKAVFNTTVGGNYSTTVLDGTIVTNFSTLAFGNKSPGQQLTELKNGAQVYVNTAENGNGAGSNSVLKVSGGSKLIASGGVRVANHTGGAMEGKGFHKLIVEGEGSLLKAGTGKAQAQAGLRIGDTYMGCSVIVTNRATLSANGLYFSSHHNNLWVSNATVTLSGGYLNLDGVSNRLDLLDCDDVSIDRLFVCGSYGRCCIRGNQGRITLPAFVNPGGNSWGKANEVEIWDTVVAADYESCNSPVGWGNVYRLMRTAVVNTAGAGIFSSAVSNHELNLCGEGTTGGVFRCTGAMTFASRQTDCWLRLMDGVRYENLADFYFGYEPKATGAIGINSTIYIGTNSTMSLQKLYVGNTGHRVVIDSGTLEAPEINLSAANRVGGTLTNSVIFAGTHPKFLYTPSAAYSLPTASGWYVFEVPSEGYEAAPLQVSKGLNIPDGAQVVVHADVEKLSRHFNGKGGLVPLMTGTSVTVSADKLAAMTQALGQPGARFVVKDNVLYLRVPAKGLMLLLR